MKDVDLGKMSVPQLVEQFTILCVDQFQAELYSEIAKQNKLIRQSIAISDELKGRAGDQRMALVPLLVHPNPQVRMMAAQFTLAVAPVAARQALQDLSDQNVYPQAAYARGTLMALDEGERNPT
jgi:hypothetical protein